MATKSNMTVSRTAGATPDLYTTCAVSETAAGNVLVDFGNGTVAGQLTKESALALAAALTLAAGATPTAVVAPALALVPPTTPKADPAWSDFYAEPQSDGSVLVVRRSTDAVAAVFSPTMRYEYDSEATADAL
jgi:hypothetical protein